MSATLEKIIALGFIIFMLASCNDINKQKAVKQNKSISDSIVNVNIPVEPPLTERLRSDIVTFPVDSLMQIKVLTTGNFHSDEVWETANKEKWTGIFKSKSDFYIKATSIKAKKVHDGFVDENEKEKTGWEITTPNKDSSIILIEMQPYLEERKIQSVTIYKNFIYPNDTVVFSFLGNRYKLFATGISKKVQGEAEALEVMKYRLYLTAYINGKETTQLLSAQPDFDDKMIELLFAGDIDGDGILDFIIDNSRHYNMYKPTLYLSMPAEKGQIVKPVGFHVSVGC